MYDRSIFALARPATHPGGKPGMDWKEVKRLALASGNWIEADPEEDHGTWIFPDGSEVAKGYNTDDLHHGQLARDIGLTLEDLDPYYGEYTSYDSEYGDESNDRYWQAVNSLSKNFHMARKSSITLSFQVWDWRSYRGIARYLRRTNRDNRTFTIQVTSNGTKLRGTSLQKTKTIGRAVKLPGRRFYCRGLHEGIERVIAGIDPMPKQNRPICTELSMGALV